MKIKKMVKTIGLTALALSLFTVLASCKTNAANNAPTATLSIKNGSLDIDPTQVQFIDITFDRAMDKNYDMFIYYDDILTDAIPTPELRYGYGWMNSFTYRFSVDLRYGTKYIIVLNDDEYCANNPNDENYNKQKSYIRDLDGNLLKMFPIEFTTKQSSISHPHNFVINIPQYSCKLAENQYAEKCQNFRVNIKPLMNHEVLVAGDTLTLKYKVYSHYNIKELGVQLCDLSNSAGGWQILDKRTIDDDFVIMIPELAATTDPANPVYYTSECVFEIAYGMAAGSLELEFFTKYDAEDPESELVDLNFVNIE